MCVCCVSPQIRDPPPSSQILFPRPKLLCVRPYADITKYTNSYRVSVCVVTRVCVPGPQFIPKIALCNRGVHARSDRPRPLSDEVPAVAPYHSRLCRRRFVFVTSILPDPHRLTTSPPPPPFPVTNLFSPARKSFFSSLRPTLPQIPSNGLYRPFGFP